MKEFLSKVIIAHVHVFYISLVTNAKNVWIENEIMDGSTIYQDIQLIKD